MFIAHYYYLYLFLFWLAVSDFKYCLARKKCLKKTIQLQLSTSKVRFYILPSFCFWKSCHSSPSCLTFFFCLNIYIPSFDTRFVLMTSFKVSYSLCFTLASSTQARKIVHRFQVVRGLTKNILSASDDNLLFFEKKAFCMYREISLYTYTPETRFYSKLIIVMFGLVLLIWEVDPCFLKRIVLLLGFILRPGFSSIIILFKKERFYHKIVYILCYRSTILGPDDSS